MICFFLYYLKIPQKSEKLVTIRKTVHSVFFLKGAHSSPDRFLWMRHSFFAKVWERQILWTSKFTDIQSANKVFLMKEQNARDTEEKWL